ncbi:uncharacterized protein LOC142340787 [Convolutriloba macropyga]|uniref:uncharacterized protein LOC142340787 n=1 Tax=Convolutriloba macropyga TaxID=536237 RepID=UPI003F5286F5
MTMENISISQGSLTNFKPPYIVGYQGHVPKVNTTTKCLGKSFAASTDIAVEKDRVKLQNQKLEQYLGINPKGEKDPTYDRSHLFGDDFTVSGYGGHIPRHRQTLGQSFKFTSQEAIDKFQNEYPAGTGIADPKMTRSMNDLTTIDFSTGAKKSYSIKQGVIYPIQIPRYGGFIPGQKFRFGHNRFSD